MSTDPALQLAADEVDESRMTLGEHLAELRMRLIRSVIAIVIAFAGIYGFRYEAVQFIQGPHNWATTELNAKKAEVMEERLLEAQAALAAGELQVPEDAKEDPTDPETYFEAGYPETKRLNDTYLIPTDLLYLGGDFGFFVRMRVCFWLALFVAGPFVLWEMWGFIAAGLYRHERKTIYTYFPFSLSLFLGGVVFGYKVMVPYALYFLGLDGLQSQAIDAQMGVDEYLGFLKGLALALGIVFQLPVVMIALAGWAWWSPRPSPTTASTPSWAPWCCRRC